MTPTMSVQPPGSLPNVVVPVQVVSPQLRDAGSTKAASPTASSPRTIRRLVRDDGICVLTFDRPDSAANVFDRATLLELEEELDFIVGAPQLKGVILTSAKRSIFIAGADLKSMSQASAGA